ncbi:MAG: YbaK/EbsC family protein [Candidatus Heimdallarchaeaceae archaeon]
MDKELKNWLDSQGIVFKLYTHPPVFTVEEARIHCGFIPGLHCKNLFLKDEKFNKFYLATLPSTDRLDYSKTKAITGSKKVKFAKEDELETYLGLTTGAVSPLGLVNDKKKEVIYLIDDKVWEAEIVSFHPNVNNESIELTKEAFHLFVKKVGNDFKIVDL